MKEVWKPISGFEDIYAVSNLGNVMNIQTNKLLKPGDNGQRLQVVLCKNGTRTNKAVHKLVAEAFVENKDKIHNVVVNHKDNNYKNNVYTNLEWCSISENTKHAYENGYNSKSKKVYQFNDHNECIAQYYSTREASRQTGISSSSIASVCRGERKTAGGYTWSYRIPKDLILMDFTENLATLSKCTERSVAAIITDYSKNQIYSIGVNGGPAGGIDCLCALGGKETCIHAETQAIAKCEIRDDNKIMYVTLSPCVTCASLIVNSGFSKVYYRQDWKDNPGIKLLRAAGITVHKI